jgi:hypothetical protein
LGFRQQTRGENGDYFVDSSPKKPDDGDKRHSEVYLSLESDTFRTPVSQMNRDQSEA